MVSYADTPVFFLGQMVDSSALLALFSKVTLEQKVMCRLTERKRKLED